MKSSLIMGQQLRRKSYGVKNEVFVLVIITIQMFACKKRTSAKQEFELLNFASE